MFLSPSIIQTVHAFHNHEHTVCTSKTEKHIHQKDYDCKLDVIKKTDVYLTTYSLNFTVIENKFSITLPYNFLTKHQQLPFSPRGPPVFA